MTSVQYWDSSKQPCRDYSSSDSVPPAETRRSDSPGFKTLERTDIVGDTAAIDAYLGLISIKTSPLRTASIAPVSLTNDLVKDPHVLYERLGCFEKLQELRIIVKQGRGVTNREYTNDDQNSKPDLSPLFKLSQLKNFFYKGKLSLSDDDAGALAAAWPRLQCLDMHQTFALHGEGRSVQRKPSSDALTVIAHRCPDLRFLRIPIDFRRITAGLISDVSDHALLEFAPSTDISVKCAPLAARHLDCLFPHLKEVGRSPSMDGWDLVRSIIWNTCHGVRQDQKNRERRLAQK